MRNKNSMSGSEHNPASGIRHFRFRKRMQLHHFIEIIPGITFAGNAARKLFYVIFFKSA